MCKLSLLSHFVGMLQFIIVSHILKMSAEITCMIVIAAERDGFLLF